MRMTLIAVAALALGTTVPVSADDFVVKHGDLDLSSVKDQKVLHRRIDSAARQYCWAGTNKTGSRIDTAKSAQCYHEARNAARARMASLVAEAQKGG